MKNLTLLLLPFVCLLSCKSNEPQPNNSNNPNNPTAPAFCKPTQMSVGSNTATLNYNANKQLTTISMPNNRVITFTYTNGRITRFTEAPTTGATTSNTSTFDFTYNAQNQVTKCDLSLNGGATQENTVSYAPGENTTIITINYKDGTAGSSTGSYPFVIARNLNGSVKSLSLSYTGTVINCGFNPPVTPSYNYTHTPSYDTNAPKSIWAEMNIDVVVRFFLNRYLANANSNISEFFNRVGTMYLSDIVPASVAYQTNGMACTPFSGGHNITYTHATNNKNIVNSTTSVINSISSTHTYTHNCD